MKIYSWKTRASCGQLTSGLHFQFEFHITVLRYMGRVSVKQFVTNCNIKNTRFFCAQYILVVVASAAAAAETAVAVMVKAMVEVMVPRTVN